MFFKDIIGQEDIKTQLRKEVNEGRIPHARLICGAPGTGKLALAVALARYICCTNRTSEDSCGHCPSCQQFNKLVHPDVHFVYPVIQKKLSEDYLPEWRELLTNQAYFSNEQWLECINSGTAQTTIYTRESDEIAKILSFKPIESEYKIVIIWQPEKMQIAGANKLLKLLEEPPQKTVFLLVSEAPDKLLTTILSRTRRIDVQKTDQGSIEQLLCTKYNLSPTASQQIAYLADGNVTKALETIHQSDEQQKHFEHFVKLMRLSYQRKIKDMKIWSEQTAAFPREEQKSFLLYCLRMVRENFMYNFHEKALNHLSMEEQNFATRFAPFINEQNVIPMMEELEEAYNHLEQNVNSKMIFFDFSLKMIVMLKH